MFLFLCGVGGGFLSSSAFSTHNKLIYNQLRYVSAQVLANNLKIAKACHFKHG